LNKDLYWTFGIGGYRIDPTHRKGLAMSHLVTNFCKREQMSICTADNQKQQVGCRYYEKSQFAERCMYYIFEEYCDSLTAQMNAQELMN
jgi:hypothetical protein